MQIVADHRRVVLEAFLLHHVEHGDGDLTRDRAAGDRREERALRLVELVGDRSGGDHRGDRIPVPGGLRDGDDVRNNVLLFESPEMVTQTPVPHLHLVGDADAASFPNGPVHAFEVAVGKEHTARVAQERLAEEGRRGPSLFRHRLDRVAGLISEARRSTGDTVARGRRLRLAELMDRSHGAGDVRAGHQHVRGSRPTVVGALEAHDIAVSGRSPRQLQSQVVGLRPGAQEEDGVHRLGHQAHEALCEAPHRAVQEA